MISREDLESKINVAYDKYTSAINLLDSVPSASIDAQWYEIRNEIERERAALDTWVDAYNVALATVGEPEYVQPNKLAWLTWPAVVAVLGGLTLAIAALVSVSERVENFARERLGMRPAPNTGIGASIDRAVLIAGVGFLLWMVKK